MDELWDAIVRCHAHRKTAGDDRAETRAADRLRLAISRQAAERVAAVIPTGEWTHAVAELSDRRVSPEQVAERLLIKAFVSSRES